MIAGDWGASLSVLSFFRKYALHLDTTHFPVLTAGRRAKRTTDREIVLLGDSHSWGQGSPDYDGVSWFSAHMAFPYSKGYYARLAEYVRGKLEFYPTWHAPAGAGLEADGGPCPTGVVPITGPVAAGGFYTPSAYCDRARDHLGYLAEEYSFGERAFLLESGREYRIRMEAHARKLYAGVANVPDGGVLEIVLETPSYYTLPDGYPKLYRVVGGEHVACGEGAILEVGIAREAEGEPGAASLGARSRRCVVRFDCRSDRPAESVYEVDFGMKQRGTLTLRCLDGRVAGAGPGDSSGDSPPPGAHARVPLRGIVFDGNRIRNFAMGGHTVGQWLGDGTDSFNDGPYAHVDELLRYVPFTPTLAVVQAPVVNEYLRQTEIGVFKMNLAALLRKLGGHHNSDGSRRMDALLFTTPGDCNVQFRGAASLPIPYDSYYAAVREFSLEYGCGFIDFRRYFVDMVDAGMLDYELLFDDAIHPSPYVNEWIAGGLRQATDLLL